MAKPDRKYDRSTTDTTSRPSKTIVAGGSQSEAAQDASLAAQAKAHKGIVRGTMHARKPSEPIQRGRKALPTSRDAD